MMKSEKHDFLHKEGHTRGKRNERNAQGELGLGWGKGSHAIRREYRLTQPFQKIAIDCHGNKTGSRKWGKKSPHH